ncbi:MAG: hypothetical protein IJT83_14005, partial [Victivallales bacterium]|nr:hypothetical protein [Victivallales bacterium]
HTLSVALQGRWGVGAFFDGEVRFAKAVATPYLSHCPALWLGWIFRRRRVIVYHRDFSCGHLFRNWLLDRCTIVCYSYPMEEIPILIMDCNTSEVDHGT